MLSRLLPLLPAVQLSSALAAPALAALRIAPPAAAVVRVATAFAGAGARTAAGGATAVSDTALRVGRVARNAMTPQVGYWRAGSRMHLALRHHPDAPENSVETPVENSVELLEAAARKVAAELAEHPDVVSAYWDGGLARLVVQTTEDAIGGAVADEAAELAAEHGLEHVGEHTLAHAHPGSAGSVRAGVLALACDAAGIAAAVAAQTARVRSVPRAVTAAATLMREDSRVRAALVGPLGADGADLLLAAAYAAAHAIGKSPVPLVLDAALRSTQLVAALAQLAAFDAVHDTLCAPDRLTVAGDHAVRPPLPAGPGEEYAEAAVNGMLAGAATTLLFTRDPEEAAEAVLAATPKAARYGPAGFTAALSTLLARENALVRDADRLRALELVDTVVLHPEALRRNRLCVLEAHPSTDDWDEHRLWQAATAALQGSWWTDDGASGAGAAYAAGETGEAGQQGEAYASQRAQLGLRPVPGQPPAEAGMMIASTGDRDVGTVLVGFEVDPMAEAALDAARRAGLHVVVVESESLGEFGTLADELAAADRPFADVVRALQDEGRTVMTVVRVPQEHTAGGPRLSPRGGDAADGLLAGDIAVAITDKRSAVVWGADVICLRGLEGVWRLLAAIPAARTVGRHAKFFTEAGAALSELLVLSRGTRTGRPSFPLEARLGPVNIAVTAALVWGWWAALGTATHTAPHPRPRIPWHALEPREVLARLARAPRSAPTALMELRAEAGRIAHAAAAHRTVAPMRLGARLMAATWAELDDPLTPVLMVGATASALLGSVVDAFLVTGAVAVNALVGGVQRLRAERALSALVTGQRHIARRVAATAADGDEEEPSIVEAEQLAPGEVIELHTNDVVPADARLLEVDGLEVDESALTGESLPTRKQLAAMPQAAVADRSCMVFQGTTVVAGHARAVVVSTGGQTEAGRAAALAARVPTSAGVQARLHELTRKVLPLTLAGGAAVTGLSLLRGRPMRSALEGGLAVAVAAVPEGMPLVATVAQMAAARRLSKLGVLVRTPRCLEALGRMDTLCFDKTGTLTENRLKVVRLVTSAGTEHQPFDPEAAPLLRLAARACPRAAEQTGVHAHATDEAVLAAAPHDTGWTAASAQPFEASRGYAAAVGSDTDGVPLLVVKGAPEVVLPSCPDAGPAVVDTALTLAAQGLRLLAVAQRRLAADETADETTEALDKPLESLEFTGFVALADTPRPSSAPLVAGLNEAGVRPVMLTGDHPETARAVALDLGWPADATVVTGDELAVLDRAGRIRLLRDCGVVARVAPEQKLQVIEALRDAGRVVGMVGDGANDAAAIRAADVGVGIATRGSAAARNAADLVITNDELSVLIDAIGEGRALWRSVADAISILLGGNAGEVGFSVLGTLLAGNSPLTTRQLLLVNLLTDMFPAMAVAVTPHDPRPNAPASAPDSASVGPAVLGQPLTRQIRQRGVVTGIGATCAWLIGSLTPGTARRTSTMALCGVIGAQLTQTILGRRRSPLILATVLGTAAVLVGLVQTPVVSHFFGCTPLGPFAWTGVALAVGTAALAPHVLPYTERLLSGLDARLKPAPTGP
ncbi:cation-translocating P-type ATPase [Streptomyces sp. FIT100]|uniref:cation-translocating P-type ATPase n=1 Tax=Streptomyces sp. FIT100 TaxID=2837956 RepID=UPI0021C648B4|nr:cation-translocating P-type ATPase [Streptomyces sp. FIT100]UUN28188.1 cation-translocating P-type ATPase [Streptomyces sp. FIT100]